MSLSFIFQSDKRTISVFFFCFWYIKIKKRQKIWSCSFVNLRVKNCFLLNLINKVGIYIFQMVVYVFYRYLWVLFFFILYLYGFYLFFLWLLTLLSLKKLFFLSLTQCFLNFIYCFYLDRGKFKKIFIDILKTYLLLSKYKLIS